MSMGEIYAAIFVLVFYGINLYSRYADEKNKWDFAPALLVALFWPLAVLLFIFCLLWDLYNLSTDQHDDDD